MQLHIFWQFKVSSTDTNYLFQQKRTLKNTINNCWAHYYSEIFRKIGLWYITIDIAPSSIHQDKFVLHHTMNRELVAEWVVIGICLEMCRGGQPRSNWWEIYPWNRVDVQRRMIISKQCWHALVSACQSLSLHLLILFVYLCSTGTQISTFKSLNLKIQSWCVDTWKCMTTHRRSYSKGKRSSNRI